MRSTIAILLAFILQLAAPALLGAPAAGASSAAVCCPLCDCGDICPCASSPDDDRPTLPDAPLPQRPTDPTQRISAEPVRIVLVPAPQPSLPRIDGAQRELAIPADGHAVLPLLCVWRT